MTAIRSFFLSLSLLMFCPVSFGADTSACMNCHDADEFSEMSAADIVADTRDPGIPPHKRFADLSDAELQTIADKLSGG